VKLRDGYSCQVCGADQNLTVDHLIPISKGGTDDLDNLLTMCGRCNFSKGAKISGFFDTHRKPLTLPFLFSPQNGSISYD